LSFSIIQNTRRHFSKSVASLLDFPTFTEYVVFFITAHETSLSRYIWVRCNIKWDLRVVLTKNWNFWTNFSNKLGGWVGPRAGTDAVAKRKLSALAGNRIPILRSPTL
jgi:hypothetical protein